MKTTTAAKKTMATQSNLESRWVFVVPSTWWRNAAGRILNRWTAADGTWAWNKMWNWGWNWKRTWSQDWKR
jgi:hypothetical protein